MTQKERILRWLNDFGSLTRAEGFTQLGIVELPARICELERMGYQFDRETVHAENRYGEVVNFTKYTLARRPHEYTTVTRAEAIPDFEEWKERIDT